jgi:hydrogenase maturation protease
MSDGGRVLVAGVGNVFLGDDGFGVAVVQRLLAAATEAPAGGGATGGGATDAALPEHVDVADYGIRGVHLAYDLLGGRHDALVLVDALPLGEPPGTLAVLEVDVDDPGWTLRPSDALEAPAADGHGMDPESVLRLLRSLGGRVRRVVVVGCQPAVVEERMELSEAVEAAVDEAVRVVAAVVREVAREQAALLAPSPDEPDADGLVGADA